MSLLEGLDYPQSGIGGEREVGIRGRWYVIDPKSHHSTFLGEKLIVDQGLEKIGGLITGRETVSNWYIAFGTGTSPADWIDTDLEAKVSSKAAFIDERWVGDEYWLYFYTVFSQSELSGHSVAELGLYADSTLVDRISFDPQTFDSDKIFLCILILSRW